MTSNSTSASPISDRGFRRIGLAVVAGSFGLRAFTAWRGGQMFWPDEGRFQLARIAVRHLFDHRYREAAEILFGEADHLLFKLVSLLPAGVEITLGTPEWVSALFFAAASTWVIWLVGRAARAAGATEEESLLALILAAGTTSLFYYARHFFPYDLALGLLLLAVITGLRGKTSRWNSACAGLWASLGFLAYNGYWTLVAAGLAAHVCGALPQPKAMVTRAGWALVGLLAPVVAILSIGGLLGHNLLASSVKFAGTVTLGDLGQAWQFVPRYFWAAEHGLAILWTLALLAAVCLAWRRGNRRLWLWSGLSLLLYVLLVVPSDLFGRFAVSARHVRVLAPFLCLVTASAACALPGPSLRRAALLVLLVFAGAQAAFNFRTPLAQVFPPEFAKLANAYLDEARKHDLGPYEIVNDTFLHNPDWAKTGPDPGIVLLRRDHPFQFVPYLFEGYTAAARALYRARDLSMRIVRLDVNGGPLAGYPSGMIEMKLRFPARPFGLQPEPVVSSGTPGHCDLLYVRYDDISHIRFGLDHWGGGSVLSPSLPLDRSRPHKLLVGMGSFFPPGTKGDSDRLFVMWDDKVVFDTAYVFHPSPWDRIDIGNNNIGASTAVPRWSAEIMSLERIPRPWPVSSATGQTLNRYPGAVQLQLQLPLNSPDSTSEPLLSTGRAGQGDLLFIRYEGGDHFRIGHDHWGGGSTLSEPFPFDRTKRLNLVVSLGSLFQADGLGPGNGELRHKLYVRCNDVVILDRAAPFHPTLPGDIAVGRNRIDSTAAGPRLTADILLFREVPAASLASNLADHPGVIRLKLRLPASPGGPATEPLLCTGRSGAGDLLFIRHEDATHLRIGLDHWGHPLALSEPVAFDRSLPLELTIAMGSLFPPESDPLFQQHPDWTPFRHRLFVVANGHIVLNQPAEFHPALAGSLAFGRNSIGASTATVILAADVLALESVSPEKILPLPPPR